jgi:sigma-B regulation protein RsbU (phosphoserine phosphatase)
MTTTDPIPSPEQGFVDDLLALNQIAATLNQASDPKKALSSALEALIQLMGLEAGWIFLRNEHKKSRWAGKGYELLCHHNLPSGMKLSDPVVWGGGCDCQAACNAGDLIHAYNEVRCSRLAAARSDTQGLTVHASVPLKSGEAILGILNVAARNWEEFNPHRLALLTNVGIQMGVALERAQLYELLRQQRTQEQRVFLDLSNHMLGRPNLQNVMDYLVDEVRHLLSVDGATILLCEGNDEFLCFRAQSGWKSDPGAAGHMIPRHQSVVMRTGQPLSVEDLQLNDPTPWMSDPFKSENFRGHAVMPLVVDERSIGLMVVNTRSPRMLNNDEMRLLQLLANQAALAIEKTRLYQEDLKHRRLTDELEVSQRIQMSMLPESPPQISGWQFAAAYEAAKLVGGDFYDFFFPHRDQPYLLGLIIADVADKGIPAALVMALSRTIIRNTAMSKVIRTPKDTLIRANELMLEDTRSEMFLSAFYAKLDTDSGWMTYTSAGHNPPLWYRAELDEFQFLHTKGIVLGIWEEIELGEETVSLAQNDIVILYTDGLTEANNPRREEYGMERIKAIVREHAYKTADEIMAELIDSVKLFEDGMDASDDFTVIVIKRE